MEDYLIKHKLGDGSQGVVYEAVRASTGEPCAVKVVMCKDRGDVNRALKEIKVLLMFRHTNIVSYVDFFVLVGKQMPDAPKASSTVHETFDDIEMGLGPDRIAVCLVMELCRNGDLQGTIQDSKHKIMETGAHPISEQTLLRWIEQCAEALQHIHAQGFLHRDLKPTNIFFDAQQNMKIGDFGLAIAATSASRTCSVGTPHYLAPERMQNEAYDAKVDVWGLGVVMLELIVLREQPLNTMVIEDPSVVETVIEPAMKFGFSRDLAQLLKSMIQRDPTHRPTATDILRRVRDMMMSARGDVLPPAVTVCSLCEVAVPTIHCEDCRTVLCSVCDQTRHAHPKRHGHRRDPVHGHHLSKSAWAHNPRITSLQPPEKALPPATMKNVAIYASPTVASPLLGEMDAGVDGRAAHVVAEALERPANARIQLERRSSVALMGDSLTSLPKARSKKAQNMSQAPTNLSPAAPPSKDQPRTICRVPEDAPTLEAALHLVCASPQMHTIQLPGGVVHSSPLILTDALPENLRIVGSSSPATVLEVRDCSCAMKCTSGKGSVEHIEIRHLGSASSRAALNAVNVNAQEEAVSGTTSKRKKAPRPSAVCITGGEWRLLRCTISCSEGSGLSVGVGKHVDAVPKASAQHHSMTEDERPRGAEPVVQRCTFRDISVAGVVVMEGGRGLFEDNHFVRCGYTAFLLKRDSSPRIVGNVIADGGDTGIFCLDGGGLIERNTITGNVGCGIVVRGPLAAPIIHRNEVLDNHTAGIFCCERAMPFITGNEVRRNSKAGIVIKTRAAPKISLNHIEGCKEAGIYVFEQGEGIIDNNHICANLNAGLLVTTGSSPYVLHNTLTQNAYEGIWVCMKGGGTYCHNKLQGNVRGAMDVELDSDVLWADNNET